MTRPFVFVVVGGLLLALGVAAMLGTGCSCTIPGDWNFGSWGTTSVDGVKLPFKATLKTSSATKLSRLVVSIDAGSVVVSGDPTVTGIEAEFEVREHVAGDASLVVTAEGVDVKSAGGHPVLVTAARIRVPRATPVQASTSLGKIAVSGIEGVDAVSATSDAGRVELRDIKSVATLTGTSNLGAVSMSDGAGLGNVKLRADAGSVTLESVVAAKRVELKTSLGAIRVDALGASESLTCETDSGSVRVSDAHTGAGRLKSDLGEVRAERSTFDHIYAHTDLGGVRLVGCTYKTKDVGTDLGSVREEK